MKLPVIRMANGQMETEGYSPFFLGKNQQLNSNNFSRAPIFSFNSADFPANQYPWAKVCVCVCVWCVCVCGVCVCVCVCVCTAPGVYGGSQARGLIQSCSHLPTPQQPQIPAASATYNTAHSNARSLTR